MKNRNLIIIGIMLVAMLFITGISYAIWQITLQQESTNDITTGCFKIEFSDINPIHLEKAYPMSDEEGMKLTPYTFTITNVCETHASYQINLEVLNSTTFTDLTIMNISLNEKEAKGYSTYDASEKTLENASFSRKLENGYLYPLEEKTFTLRLWMDEDTPTEDAYMNQSFQSKVTIVTSYLKEAPTYAEVITNCSKNGYQTTECMLENSKYDTENLAYDETVDNNLRYIGSNPNNYVSFNNELWRIIGVMNNVEDSEGSIDSRIKLVRSETIGQLSWDTSPSNINDGYGINEWSQADLMKLLNPGYENEAVGGSLYWGRTNGNCYIDFNHATNNCNFSNTGLLNDSKSMIEEVVWQTGGNGTEISWNQVITAKSYELERSHYNGKICTRGAQCTDTVTRTITWRGMIGLMYPSDYGYATSGGSTMNRTTCLNTQLANWNSNADCYQNDYIYQLFTVFHSSGSNSALHTLMPLGMTTGNQVHAFMRNDGLVGEASASVKMETFPTLYLKSSVKIMAGEGSQEHPYELEMKK